MNGGGGSADRKPCAGELAEGVKQAEVPSDLQEAGENPRPSLLRAFFSSESWESFACVMATARGWGVGRFDVACWFPGRSLLFHQGLHVELRVNIVGEGS